MLEKNYFEKRGDFCPSLFIVNQDQKSIEWLTHRGKITIRSFCSSDEIASLSFKETHTKYARCRPIISKKETLIKAASQRDANVTLAFTADGKVVGLGILQYPPPEERWTRVGDRIMMEVSVIEVNRAWRSMGISREIVRFLMDHPLKEDRIFYMVGYSWTWDLEDMCISAMAYRDMLISIFSRQGFKSFQTNEPNIMLRPENLFMARIGTHISEDIQKQFKWVRFDLDLYV